MFFLFAAMLILTGPLLVGQNLKRPRRPICRLKMKSGTVLSAGLALGMEVSQGRSKLQTSEMSITADEIDFNSDTNWAYARGHVRLEHFLTGDVLNADHGEYNLKTEEGKFYTVSGTPGENHDQSGHPDHHESFLFPGALGRPIRNRYVLHKGFVTDCKMPKPWWTFQCALFDIVPGRTAIARHTVFRLKHVPVLYLPYFYRPLGKNTRRSGSFTPNIGHSPSVDIW